MNILIIGNGGREHALAWKVRQSPLAQRVFVAPGNAGTALEPGVDNVAINATDSAALLDFAADHAIDLVIVGPEAPLAAGIVDQFNAHNIPCFGPTQAAARLESSKAFSKSFMAHYHIPTARYASFTDLATAKAYVQHHPLPLVIKADGLMAGKGVVIAPNLATAETTLDQMLQHGGCVVIEEFLSGEEASFIVLAAGEHAIPLASSQDHKALYDGDNGPNTGGMGAYSPAPVVTPALQQRIMHEVIYPTLHGLIERGTPYTGFLYAGLMITPSNDIKVLEFNCRLGDPETQPLLMRLTSDLVSCCLAALQHNLTAVNLEWDPRPALGVVLATSGYPNTPITGDIIHGLPAHELPGCKLFHSGTTLQQNHVVTAGGRVLCATALGENVRDAQQKAYQLASKVHWEHQYYRSDIGYRAVTREELV